MDGGWFKDKTADKKNRYFLHFCTLTLEKIEQKSYQIHHPELNL